jgi:hypothetical protein
MLDIKILLEVESSFTGCITLYLNQGGVRTAKTSEKVLNVLKKDSFKPTQSIFERPTST